MDEQMLLKLREWLKQTRAELKGFALHAESEGLSPLALWFIDGQRTMCRLVELQLDIWESERIGGQ